jgi:hypothetical protein
MLQKTVFLGVVKLLTWMKVFMNSFINPIPLEVAILLITKMVRTSSIACIYPDSEAFGMVHGCYQGYSRPSKGEHILSDVFIQ